MPTVVREGDFSFIIHTLELPFEPPHVHVAFGGEEVRIELVGGTFMDNPPCRETPCHPGPLSTFMSRSLAEPGMRSTIPGKRRKTSLERVDLRRGC